LVVGRTVTVKINNTFKGLRSMLQFLAINASVGADIDPKAVFAGKILRASCQCEHRSSKRPSRKQC